MAGDMKWIYSIVSVRKFATETKNFLCNELIVGYVY